MRALRRFLWIAVPALLLSVSSPAYYHFVHFASRVGPFTPLPEKFDLTALPDKTVYFYISEQGPAQLAPGDTVTGLISQIRAAARAWNSVETSDLRIAFGGMSTPNVPQSNPGIDVIFDEVPPGLIALGGPTTRAEAVAGPNGAFIPIVRSVVVLRRDLSTRPSYSEEFFLTVAHELGHALGLQHTLCSSLMSTATTRATTKGKPLAADDVAGISVLYPTRRFQTSTGSLAGRVVMDGEGVNLASVVALPPGGPAVSALTNPDGNYRIDGLQPGVLYLVYVHPLPPPLTGEVTHANLVLPTDPTGAPLPVGPPFDTVFYPGTKDPGLAYPVSVVPGGVVEGINFSVQRRASVPLYAVQTYSFPGQIAVKPASIIRGSARQFLVATGVGLIAGGGPAPGLSVRVIGGAASVPPGGIRPYPSSSSYIQIDLEFNFLAADGPYHLLFSLGNDIYVLPSAFLSSAKSPPSLTSVAPGVDVGGNRLVVLSGTNLSAETRILFDGQPALRVVEDAGRLLVTPPAAPGGHAASVVAVNTDGQSSLFLQQPLTYVYEPAEPAAAITLNPGTLAAGAEALVEINGINTQFVDGQTSIGFGSSDVVVRRSWVVSPTRILANVAVASGALPQPVGFTAVTGLRLISQPYAFQTAPVDRRQISLGSQVVNAQTGLASVQPGAQVVLPVSNLSQALIAGGLSLSFNGERVPVLAASTSQIIFQVPVTASPGPVVVRLQAGAETSLPIALLVDPPLPAIALAFVGLNTQVTPMRPAARGEVVSLLVTNLADTTGAVNPDRVRVTVGGVSQPVIAVTPYPAQQRTHVVQFLLSPAAPLGQQPVTVAIEERTSPPFALPVI